MADTRQHYGSVRIRQHSVCRNLVRLYSAGEDWDLFWAESSDLLKHRRDKTQPIRLLLWCRTAYSRRHILSAKVATRLRLHLDQHVHGLPGPQVQSNRWPVSQKPSRHCFQRSLKTLQSQPHKRIHGQNSSTTPILSCTKQTFWKSLRLSKSFCIC